MGSTYPVAMGQTASRPLAAIQIMALATVPGSGQHSFEDAPFFQTSVEC